MKNFTLLLTALVLSASHSFAQIKITKIKGNDKNHYIATVIGYPITGIYTYVNQITPTTILNQDGTGIIQHEDFTKENATLLKEPTLLSKSNVKVHPAAEACTVVMKEAGACLRRDVVDLRIIGYLESLGKSGQIFKTEADAGGQSEVKEIHNKIKDADHDGIPDQWESRMRLNAKNAADAALPNASGYSNLEEYINSLTAKKTIQTTK